MTSSFDSSKPLAACEGGGGADEPRLGEQTPKPKPPSTLCDVVHFVAMNGFPDACVRCVSVCKSMRTNAELWERVVDLQHAHAGARREIGYRATRLIHAAGVGERVRVREMLDRGARVNACDTLGYTALCHARDGGHDGVATELLARGATDGPIAALGIIEAVGYGDTAMVRDMIARGADVNAWSGWTPLTFCCFHGHVATATELLRLDADVNAQNNSGKTALMCAAIRGHVDVVRLLLAAPGVDVNLANHGRTALSSARNHGHPAIVTLLEAAGAH